MDQIGGGEGFFTHVYNDLVHSVPQCQNVQKFNQMSDFKSPSGNHVYFFNIEDTLSEDT